MELYEKAPMYLVLDNKQLVIAHAGIKQELIEREIMKSKNSSYTEILQVKNTQMVPLSEEIGLKVIMEMLILSMDIPP